MPARIVVIEDNPTNLELMRYVLAAFGHEVLGAHDGESGLQAVERSRPDLVVCDLQLPGIDGFEVARRLKAHAVHRGIPLVAVTAFAMVGDRERVLAAGFDGYIPKPIDPRSFIDQIDGFLARNGRSRRGEPAAAAPAGPPPPPVRQRGAGKTVLVVDDTQPNLDLLEAILVSEGYRVLAAAGVAQARALAEAHSPDIYISDVHLGAESGFDLIRWVRGRRESMQRPFLFVSSSALADADRRRGAEWGATRFLLRPIEAGDLLDEVASCAAGDCS